MPFRPRASDHWAVGGPRRDRSRRAVTAAPRCAQANGPHEVPVKGVDASIDQPVVDPALRTAPPLAVADPLTTAGATSTSAAVDPGGLRREVFGFLPYWELNDSSTRLDWDKISTVAYFGSVPTANGNLQKHNSDGSTTAAGAAGPARR